LLWHGEGSKVSSQLVLTNADSEEGSMEERKVLLVSIWATLFFAVLGVVFGVLSESSIIIFDGVYSLVSLGLSLLSLLVLKQLESGAKDHRFPFGKAHFEPLLIIFKSIALIGMCLYSSMNALVILCQVVERSLPARQ
jgi:predicted Co/Zn/Cd cation transporter (cation efflux family)